jgi:hypothetical protein
LEDKVDADEQSEDHEADADRESDDHEADADEESEANEADANEDETEVSAVADPYADAEAEEMDADPDADADVDADDIQVIPSVEYDVPAAYGRSESTRQQFLRKLSFEVQYQDMLRVIRSLPVREISPAEEAKLLPWATFESRENHASETIHTDLDNYYDFILWTQSSPYQLSDSKFVCRRAGERIALAIGLLLRDVFWVAKLKVYSKSLPFPKFIFSTVIPSDTDKTYFLPFCREVVYVVSGLEKNAALSKKTEVPIAGSSTLNKADVVVAEFSSPVKKKITVSGLRSSMPTIAESPPLLVTKPAPKPKPKWRKTEHTSTMVEVPVIDVKPVPKVTESIIETRGQRLDRIRAAGKRPAEVDGRRISPRKKTRTEKALLPLSALPAPPLRPPSKRLSPGRTRRR